MRLPAGDVLKLRVANAFAFTFKPTFMYRKVIMCSRQLHSHSGFMLTITMIPIHNSVCQYKHKTEYYYQLTSLTAPKRVPSEDRKFK